MTLGRRLEGAATMEHENGLDTRPGHRGKLQTSMRRVGGLTPLWYLISLAILVFAWQVVYWLKLVPAFILPGPSVVYRGSIDYHGVLLTGLRYTLGEFLVTVGISMAIGVVLGLAIAFWRPLQRLAMPLLVTLQALPKIALAPIMLVIFGIGFRTDVLVGVIVACFPVIMNIELGIRSIDADYIKLGRAMGGNPLRILRYVRLPSALPAFFAGLKVAITLALTGVIVGEFIAGNQGLGYLALTAIGNQNTELNFTSICWLAALGLVVFGAASGLERFGLRHYPDAMDSKK